MNTTASLRRSAAPAGNFEYLPDNFDPDPTILDRLLPDGVEFRIDTVSGRLLRVALYSAGATLSLEAVLRLFAGFDLRVLDHRIPEVRRRDGMLCRVYDFLLVRSPSGMGQDERRVDVAALTDAMRAIWAGQAETDRFGVLVLTAGLTWQEVAVLRAYARFLRQTALPHGYSRIQDVLIGHPGIAAALIGLFHAQFDPSVLEQDRPASERSRGADLDQRIEQVVGLDADRILRAYANLVRATTRTSFYRDGGLGAGRTHLALKFDSGRIEELPKPRPVCETFVYSPRMEGVHLRFGLIARGGLRWSDRLEDYRVEILGLARAQEVKNAVIVPAGAKGGFVVREPPAPTGDPGTDRTALAAAGLACYAEFVTGLLDVADNRDAALATVHPRDVICRDGEDAYLVVAPDKGTATFSDLANEIAAARGFWLGDAFASGGSVGYDHKTMGITAKGAWIGVTRHLAERGIDVDRDVFTVAGIGDMSGDVFGNGMLASRCTALVAAFDHRHIFIDPAPDPHTSWHERKRLFELAGSSWDDYNRALISTGGGVWPRDCKSIPISGPTRASLGIPESVAALTPPELIRAILTAPVDLLYNGGIGTYVRASAETDAEVRDKANDAVRVPATELRAAAVAEGGNLGLTQPARIEYARAGGQINTDALDNSAGVDCSDHEVNIKILIDTAREKLQPQQRAALLASLEDAVAEHVLANNRAHNLILGEAHAHAARYLTVHAEMVANLELRHGLNRAQESLPDAAEFATLAQARLGLTSPELATLLAHAKLDLESELVAGEDFHTPYFDQRLADYFPSALTRIFPAAEHPLRQQIRATELVNEIFAVGGLTYAHRLRSEAGATAHDIVRAYVVAAQVFDLPALITGITSAHLPPPVVYKLLAEARRLLDRASRWFLAYRPQPIAVDIEIDRFRERVLAHGNIVSSWLCGDEADTLRRAFAEYAETGVPGDIAEQIATGLYRFSLLDILEVADECGRTVDVVAATYFALSNTLGIDSLLIEVSALPRAGQWGAQARLALRDDLYRSLRLLTRDVLARDSSTDADTLIGRWLRDNHTRIARAQRRLRDLDGGGSHDVTQLIVAARQIRFMVDLG